jgi:anti-anti-sigma factor
VVSPQQQPVSTFFLNKNYNFFMKDEELEIIEDRSSGAVKFTLKGRVNAVSADALLYKLETAVNEGHTNIVVNMSRVEYLSSVGIRVILKIYKKAAEKGGKFNIERPSENVKNVLGMVALKDMLVE